MCGTDTTTWNGVLLIQSCIQTNSEDRMMSVYGKQWPQKGWSDCVFWVWFDICWNHTFWWRRWQVRFVDVFHLYAHSDLQQLPTVPYRTRPDSFHVCQEAAEDEAGWQPLLVQILCVPVTVNSASLWKQTTSKEGCVADVQLVSTPCT